MPIPSIAAAGTEDLQGVGVEMVRHGPGGHGDGLCHHHLPTRRKRGGRGPVRRLTTEAVVSIYGVSTVQAGLEADA